MEEFEQIYMRHYRSVFRYVLGLTSSIDEAEEITADTFERAFGAWPTRPPAPGSELAWLLLTGRGRAPDRWRGLPRLPRLSQLDPGHHATAGHNVEFWLWF